MRVLCFVATATAAWAAASTNESLFESKIAPVLSAQCGSCHGGNSPQAALTLGSLDAVLRGGKQGAALTPGNARQSLLIQYLRGEKQPKMPLGGSLPEATIAALAAAIDEMKPATAQRDPYAEWLFSKPKARPVPNVTNKKWISNPIDAFILARLEAAGIAPAPEASRRALIRRVYFDLIGLPPSPDEIETFAASTAPDAYEKLLDRLLADSRYGERWARHWLDLVRFAESDGFAIDGERPTAWRYRDWVIRSLNQDKPYDQFIQEQIAGDEIGERSGPADNRSERLVALGFLRMGTWEADANFKTQLRQDFLNEMTSTTSSVFLGLTTGCARCHDHKYDPIPQRDFYRLQAFFAATRVDERPAPFLKIEDPPLKKRLLRDYEDAAEAAAEELKNVEETLKRKYIEVKGLKPDDKAAGDYQKSLRDKKDPSFTSEDRKLYTETRDRARRLGELPARIRPVAYSVSDVTPPDVPSVADTYVLAGGDLAAKREKVEPGFPECMNGSAEAAKIPFAGRSSGRRRALAEWIGSAENPLTARVMVNRIWQHHFGEGLVRTPSDFGRNGERPSHPELLDWLATQFAEKKWSIKAMHKLMLMSSAYRQSSAHPEAARYAATDPDNRLLWRMNWLRLESEVVRDSLLALSGRLEPAAGGPGMFFNVSPEVAEGFEFFKWFPSSEKEQNRRSIYAFQRRSVMMPMMEVFDGANMSESCARRSVTTVAPQAFSLLNSDFTNAQARALAARIEQAVGPSRDLRIDRAFRMVLGRAPSEAEMEKSRTIDLARLAVVLFNVNEFIYLE